MAEMYDTIIILSFSFSPFSLTEMILLLYQQFSRTILIFHLERYRYPDGAKKKEGVKVRSLNERSNEEREI